MYDKYEFRKIDGVWQRREVKTDGPWLTLVSEPRCVFLPSSRKYGADRRKEISGEFMTTTHVWSE